MIKPPRVPCGTCPYRRDVPSGIWAREEYEKLPPYDRETWQQPQALFMCHQKDGCLCGGWLLSHGTDKLLALRIAAMRNELDPATWEYEADVEVFASGAEAASHGMEGIDAPTPEARKKIAGLVRKRS